MGWFALKWFLTVRGIVVSIPWKYFESAQWSLLAIFLAFTAESFDEDTFYSIYYLRMPCGLLSRIPPLRMLSII